MNLTMSPSDLIYQKKKKKMHFKINICDPGSPIGTKSSFSYSQKMLNVDPSCSGNLASVIEIFSFSLDYEITAQLSKLRRKWLNFDCERMLAMFTLSSQNLMCLLANKKDESKKPKKQVANPGIWPTPSTKCTPAPGTWKDRGKWTHALPPSFQNKACQVVILNLW